jgi:hypothetical protein
LQRKANISEAYGTKENGTNNTHKTRKTVVSGKNIKFDIRPITDTSPKAKYVIGNVKRNAAILIDNMP